MIYPKIPLAQSIIEICLAKGLTNIIISPGSRNAPLTIGFVSNPKFNCYSIADERSAAFFAVGIAQQTKKPTVVICTSGSALLNFYPAFAEAFYSQIPLIVISADRPLHMIDIGDGQTIRQANVFQSHSLYNANLHLHASPDNDFMINEAINQSFIKKGPVHINAPFEEPLYEIVRKVSVDPNISAFAKVYKTVALEDILAATNVWNSATKKLILVGVNAPNEIDPIILEQLASDPSVVVMTESTSNLHNEKFISHIDRFITPLSSKELLALQPEIVLTFGGMVVSKRIKTFLRKYKPKHHWHVDSLRAYDTFGILSRHFESNPNDFFNQFLPFAKNASGKYSRFCQKIVVERQQKHKNYTAKSPYSDFTVFDNVIATLPKDIQLQVSNSSAIRYAQLFPIHASIEVFCNRGTSGIDGSTSTAIGAALASEKPTVLITGDIGFLYDSNALWNNYIPQNFKIIIVNNGGGGIFRILPGHKEDVVFNTFFETSHQLTAANLAKMYGLKYYSADSLVSLDKIQPTFYSENEQPAILEIFTPTKVNDKVLLQYFKEIA